MTSLFHPCDLLFNNRLEKAGSCVKHYHCLHILLLAILLAVYFFFVVTVDVHEEKDEAEIVAWLKQVFANKLHTCLSPNMEETTVAPTSPQTTSPYTSYETTLVKTATSTLQSYNSTTALAITRLKSNNHTTNATTTTETNCSVLLRLKQKVPLYCIFRTLYEASRSSSDIHVVGANKTGCLVFINQIRLSFHSEDTGTVAPLGNSTHCGAVHSPYNCSAYCNGVEAYYTFRFSVQDSKMNFSYISCMIYNLSKPDCPSREDDSCPLSVIASEYRNANVTCGSTSPKLQICRVTLRFGHEVPICNFSNAVIHLFESEPGIHYIGTVTRAAICGNSFSDNPLNSINNMYQLNLPPAYFCPTIVESNLLTCHGRKNILVELKESCDVEAFIPSPDVTISQPNTSTSSVNVTSSTLTATSPALNATLTTANVTESASLKCTLQMFLTAAESQANALLELTRDTSKLNSSQVRQLVSKLERLLSGPTVSFALGNISVHIVSNLLGATPEVLSDSSNSIIGVVDTVGLKLVLDGKVENLLSSAVALSVKPADGSNFQETVFSISDPKTVQVRGGPSRPSRKVRADTPLPQGSIKLPPSLTEDLTSEEQQLVSRVQFNFYQKDTVYQDSSLRGKRKLNSGILGASAANLTIKELQDDVVIQLKNTGPVPANCVAICVFWDITFNSDSGGWNPSGCSVRKSTDNETVCGCNHLTSFAILLDLARQPLTSRTQATILTFITYIGCGVSAIFLSITLLTYLAFGKLRKDIPSKILIQLCLALLLLNLVFLVDAWLALYPEAVGLCISTAWFLHYFLLVTFTWMGLEAVQMYLALVKVFNSYISHYMVKFSLIGWGVPMIVVIIVIAVDKDNYGLVSYGKFSDGTSDGFCWLKNDIAFYVSVVAYFCLIFVFNFVMFVVVLVQLCRIKRQNLHNLQHRSILQDMRSVSGITILLGLTWGFAFFAWGPLNLPFMYLFAIFNSFQGFFIFIFYCAGKENVRKQWRTFLCCSRMRLAENSEWSRTATQKTTTKSSVNRVTSLHSSNSSQFNNSSSCFLVSDSSELTNGISSQFEDHVITAEEDYSTDVVLNEINMQYRNQQTP
nr:adhesion G-protein coupled receptor G2 [Pseudochaenichthys georgianus]